ncbi:MAG: SDR family oxidoreductase [Candidatus Cloacimonadia bacterium]
MTDLTIITGANGNVGFALAERLAKENKKLLLLYHKNSEKIEKLSNEYSELITTLSTDISDYEKLKQDLSPLISNNCNPVALVHTAAMRSIDAKELSDSDPLIWQKVVQVNLVGTYNVLRIVLPFMIKRNKAIKQNRHIVLFGSNVSRTGLPNGTAYSAAKSAISNLTLSLANEIGKHQILINTVSPGPIVIDASHFSPEYRKFREDYYAVMLKKTPLQRLAIPEDVVNLTYFLISEQNSFVTGEDFFITGGKL